MRTHADTQTGAHDQLSGDDVHQPCAHLVSGLALALQLAQELREWRMVWWSASCLRPLYTCLCLHIIKQPDLQKQN